MWRPPATHHRCPPTDRLSLANRGPRVRARGLAQDPYHAPSGIRSPIFCLTAGRYYSVALPLLSGRQPVSAAGAVLLRRLVVEFCQAGVQVAVHTPSTDRPIERAGTSFTILTWENLETSTKRRNSLAAVAPREDVISSYLPPGEGEAPRRGSSGTTDTVLFRVESDVVCAVSHLRRSFHLSPFPALQIKKQTPVRFCRHCA